MDKNFEINRKKPKRSNLKVLLICAFCILCLGLIFFRGSGNQELLNHESDLGKDYSMTGSSISADDLSSSEKKIAASGNTKFLKQFSKKDQEQLKKDAAAGNLILVNKQNAVPKDYVPSDLADISYYAKDRAAETRFMRAEAAEHFNLMAEDASSEGVDFVMTTAYRSYDFQTNLFNYYVSQKGSEEEANKTSARPGQSEHQTGLAVDVSCADIDYKISSDFANTQAGQWLRANCYKYGFILRYTAESQDITGYLPEAWHFRYVGSVAAKYIWENDITLEEFLEQSGLTHSYEELYAQ